MQSRDILEIDYLILLPVIGLVAIGIVFIYSAGITAGGTASTEYTRQIIWASLGLAIALALSMISYRRFHKFAPHMYFATLIPLALPIIYGTIVSGFVYDGRWFRVGGVGLQVSEFAKITTIILLARYLADTRLSTNSFIRFAMSCGIVAIPMGLVFVQPDLGTALVFIPILLFMTFISGIDKRYVFFAVACIALTAVLTVLPFWQEFILRKYVPIIDALNSARLVLVAILSLSVIAATALFGFLKYRKKYFFWIVYAVSIVVLSLGVSYAARSLLRPYQIMRLVVFLDPSIDPRGAGWNIIQSTTAIGAGGLTGVGFLQGTQSYFRYLPEQSTDFIFSVFSEEAGFIGGMIVFLLFMTIFMRLLRVMKITADPFAAYICAGIVGMFSFHFLINVGMTMGIMPITGIPLIFLSYGGSSMLSSMVAVGLALSVHVRRYTQLAV
ncbi:MAG: rod shape-determining protein RodA [Treponema sp.]|nr:rod shape-determining protein RodA [Treponema sp.]